MYEESYLAGKLKKMIRCSWYRTAAFFLLTLWIYIIFGWFIESSEDSTSEDNGVIGEFLVRSPKCHMVSMNPFDSSVIQYVKKLTLEPCSDGPLLSSIKNHANGSFSLVIDPEVADSYDDHLCCWTPITRSVPHIPLTSSPDSSFHQGECKDFVNQVLLPPDLEVVKVSCRVHTRFNNVKGAPIYENIHPVLNRGKVQAKLKKSQSPIGVRRKPMQVKKKMSVLILGIDSVSRLNFKRSLPKTERHLNATGWLTLQGYNKIGDNTFPNLMAILTGQNSTQADTNCDPTRLYGLDNCSFLWSNFRNAGYVTAYGEDMGPWSTFNYQKTGFIDPPTDYYLRTYMLASEQLLKGKNRFGTRYCSGPKLEMDRIFSYAFDFAETFVDSPYFGLFWTNTVSHNDLNGISTVDDYLLEMFEKIEKSGVMNDTLVVFLSDHGIRWGEMRNTYIGWYEERLPFIYLKLPSWMNEKTRVTEALRINEHRLTSPYDLYETFREVLEDSGGKANASSGCSKCQSLFKPVPKVRSCGDVGVSPHWCTCTSFMAANVDDEIIQEAAQAFFQLTEKAIEGYKDGEGRRLCARLQLARIHKVYKISDFGKSSNNSGTYGWYFFSIEATPGGGRFEVTIGIHGKRNYSISYEEISRIDSYATTSYCLYVESKKFCHCIYPRSE